MKSSFRTTAIVGIALFALVSPSSVHATTPDSSSASLPDAPQAEVKTQTSPGKPAVPQQENTFFGLQLGPAFPHESGRWDTIINSSQRARRLSATDKLLYAGHEQIQPIVLVPAIFSAGYGQVTDANPHYGTDSGGFGERFGAAMLRQATDRISGDGILSAVFHQDPRFYRDAQGPVLHRGLHAVSQTFVRRTDNGTKTFNASGILGHAVANALTVTYYPHVSATASIAAQGFGTSVAADLGSKLILEFGPDLLRTAFRRDH